MLFGFNIFYRTGLQKLEVGDGTKSVDYRNIVNEENKVQQKNKIGWQGKNKWLSKDVENSEDFIDDPNVPALIWMNYKISNKYLFQEYFCLFLLQ